MLFLQETNTSSSSNQSRIKQKFSNWPSFWNSHCGLLFKNPSLNPRNTKSYLNDRVLTTEITWNSFHILLVCIYAPSSNLSDKLNFFLDCIQLNFNYENCIWAGDFNCWINPLTDHIPNISRPPHGHMEFRQLQSWYGLMDSALTYQDCYPPMTRHSYVGGQVRSSSRIDYIFLNSLLYNLVSSSTTQMFPQSDHSLVSITLTDNSTADKFKWTKILPCNVSGWRFKKNINKIFSSLKDNCTFEDWATAKQKLVSLSHHTQHQQWTSTKAKIQRTQNFLNHLEANQPRTKFSLAWSVQWATTFEKLKNLHFIESKVNMIRSGVKWSS